MSFGSACSQLGPGNLLEDPENLWEKGNRKRFVWVVDPWDPIYLEAADAKLVHANYSLEYDARESATFSWPRLQRLILRDVEPATRWPDRQSGFDEELET